MGHITITFNYCMNDVSNGPMANLELIVYIYIEPATTFDLNFMLILFQSNRKIFCVNKINATHSAI